MIVSRRPISPKFLLPFSCVAFSIPASGPSSLVSKASSPSSHSLKMWTKKKKNPTKTNPPAGPPILPPAESLEGSFSGLSFLHTAIRMS